MFVMQIVVLYSVLFVFVKFCNTADGHSVRPSATHGVDSRRVTTTEVQVVSVATTIEGTTPIVAVRTLVLDTATGLNTGSRQF